MRYVALLRGIMPMNPNMKGEKLRQTFEGLGLTNVHTVIASGNVIFDSDLSPKKLESMIEAELPLKLGFSSTTIIRSRQDLAKMVKQNPFKNLMDEPKSRLNVTFLKSPANAAGGRRPAGSEIVTTIGKQVFTTIDLSTAKTPDLMSWLEKQFGRQITTRTWKTIFRILAKFEQTE